MGGGAAMRAAGKLAGVGIMNAGLRGGVPSVTAPVEQSLRNLSRPATVPSISSGKVSGGGEVLVADKVAWDMDDWEFAGAEEDFVVESSSSSQPMARVVFAGGAPSLQEAQDATSELKDALDKVYLSTPEYVGQVSDRPLRSNTESFDTKNCITYDPSSASVSVPKQAMQAFKMLSENPGAQSVVASIACDPNVWNAVMQNESLMEFLQSQKTKGDVYEEQETARDLEESSGLSQVGDTESQSGDTGSSFKSTGFFEKVKEIKDSVVFENVKDSAEKVKNSVVEMVSNVSDYLQNIFAAPSTSEKTKADAGDNFFDKTTTFTASFVALAMMVISIVVLKRPC